jgi:hypothetical protein
MDQVHFSRRGPHRHDAVRWRLGAGIALIVLGVVYALSNFGVISAHLARDVLPALIVAGGLVRLLTARHIRQVIKGVLHFAFAAWLFACLEHIHGLTLAQGWPFLLILIGLGALSRGFFGRKQAVVEVQ